MAFAAFPIVPREFREVSGSRGNSHSQRERMGKPYWEAQGSPEDLEQINNPARGLTAYRAGSNFTLDHITSNAVYETTRSTVRTVQTWVRILCIGGGGGNRIIGLRSGA